MDTHRAPATISPPSRQLRATLQADIGGMKIFVPLTDEMLDSGDFGGLLVPYQPGQALFSQCAQAPAQSKCNSSRSPVCKPSSEALPALSSSTYCAGPSLG